MLSLRSQGAGIPLNGNKWGRYELNVVAFGERYAESRRASRASPSPVEWAICSKLPDLPNGGSHPRFADDGMCSSTTPLTVPACDAVTLGAVREGALADPKKIIANWGRAAAQ